MNKITLDAVEAWETLNVSTNTFCFTFNPIQL